MAQITAVMFASLDGTLKENPVMLELEYVLAVFSVAVRGGSATTIV